MNIKALLQKIEKNDNNVTYVKCACSSDLIGVTFDRCMIYWIRKNLIPNPINILEPQIDFEKYTATLSIVRYIFNSELLSVHNVKHKKVDMLLLNNKVLINKKLLKYIDINKVWFFIEDAEDARYKPVHIYKSNHLIATVYPVMFEKEQIQTWNEKADKIERIL